MRGGTVSRLAAVLVALASLTANAPAHAQEAPPGETSPGETSPSETPPSETPPTAAPGPAPSGPFADVPADHWAASSISYVTHPDREWIPARAEGFGPGDPLTRRDLVRALTRMVPPAASYTSDRTFADIEPDDPMLDDFRFAAQKHWLPVKDERIRPAMTLSRRIFDPAIVRALGYTPEANGIARLQTKDGRRLFTGSTIGFVLVAQRLELYPNLSQEDAELRPGQVMTRAHAAMALHRAAAWLGERDAWPNWRLTGYADPPMLPALDDTRWAAAKWAVSFAAFPYIWGGEWHRKTPSGYPYGAQPQGGFDCSGYAWWVMQQSSDSWNVPSSRGYEGWSLGGRTATDIARKAAKKIAFTETRPLDLAFFELNGDPTRFEHMGVLLGGGWMIHSSGGRGGVSLEQINSGYWREKFAYARRVIPKGA